MATTSSDPRPIHIGLPLVIVAAAAYLAWFLPFSADAQSLYDEADASFQRAQVSYVQTIPLAKGQPPLILMKNDPFRLSSTWAYVSPAKPMSKQYKPPLVPVGVAHTSSPNADSLQPRAAEALRKLFNAAEQAGYPLMVASAYRSADDQQAVYDSYVRARGKAAADAYVAQPGTSEHQTGLAVDIDNADSACQQDVGHCSLLPPTAEWLAKHAPEYGFILRYPEGKSASTGISYEPWHFRYVGPGAAALSASGLTLDELYTRVRK